MLQNRTIGYSEVQKFQNLENWKIGGKSENRKIGNSENWKFGKSAVENRKVGNQKIGKFGKLESRKFRNSGNCKSGKLKN